MTHKETQGILAWLYLQTSDLDETDGEYFKDKHNNALKVIEQINNKLKITRSNFYWVSALFNLVWFSLVLNLTPTLT